MDPKALGAGEIASLYIKGPTWIYRVHPLSKLAVVPAITVLAAVSEGFQLSLALVAILVVVAVLSGVGRLALGSLKILIPIGISLFLIHAPFNPANQTPFLKLGPLTLYQEGALFALTTISRLAAFVISISMALWTTHPKALVTALVQKGVSHKLCYSYLAGAELIPDMRDRARAITEAQQARGFDTKGSLRRRFQTTVAMMKPLLVGALISVETRSLALESRGFSLARKHSSTVRLQESRADRLVRWLALAVAVLGILWAVIT